MDPDQNITEQSTPISESSAPKKNSSVVIAIALFFFVIAAMFIAAFLLRGDGMTTEDTGSTENTEDRYSAITRVDGKHFYIDGVHTVVGEIPMPTPCDLLESSARVAESMPEQVTLEFVVVNNAEFCAETITPQRFKVSASASESATFRAEFQGRPIELNLIEAAEGETPDEFELFIKG